MRSSRQSAARKARSNTNGWAYKDFTEALERGWGDRDSRSPMQLQNQRAGVPIKESAEDVQKTLARG